MSYIFIVESDKLSDKVKNNWNTLFKSINKDIVKSKLPIKKIKSETISPEELFDVKSFHNEIEEQGTTTGSVGGSYVAALDFTPKKMSMFAPKGTKEYEEGKKILKNLEKPKIKYTKKEISETFLSEEEIEEQGTTTGSVGGSYVTNKVWAKDKKNWRGTKKLYPGGKFVSIPERCKKYPYCDQGAGSVELSDSPKDELSPVFENKKKGMDDMYDDEIFSLRDSEYLKLIEIIESVNKLTQYPAVKKLWELFQKKFDGYMSKHLISRTNKIINDKYDELTHNQNIDDDIVSESDKKVEENKDKDYEKVLKIINSVKNFKQINAMLKSVVNFIVKYDKKLSEEENDKINEFLHKKIQELSKDKKEVSENTQIKTIHRKINE
jgi:hypothetical protein